VSLAITTATLILLSVASFGEEEWLTRSGFYRVSFDSELSPIQINRIHDWVFTVTTAEGDAVTGAVISVTGGMPLHNHGLPTQPRMTEELGEGRYLVEGMRFHMNGEWELLVTIDVSGRRDTVVIPLTI
jgi:hypothetical protein